MSGDAIACIDLFLNALFNFVCAICWQVHFPLNLPRDKGERVFPGWRNKDESLYVFLSPATYFNLLYPTLPTQVKVKRWKSERMQAPYKEQKASNAVHLPLYWNVLSFSFTVIEFSLDISFRVVMQPTSPLGKVRKRGDYLCRTDIRNALSWLFAVCWLGYFMRQFGIKNNAHSTYRFISECAF